MRGSGLLAPRRGRTTLLPVLAVLLLVGAAGCAGRARVDGAWPQREITQASVERLPDGRIGFVIEEDSSLDGALRDRFDAGVAALQAEDFEAAVAAFNEVVEAGPTITAPYLDLAIALRLAGSEEDVEPYLQQALEYVPGHPLVSQEYGLRLRREGRFDEARGVYVAGLKAFPEYYPLRKNLAILCDLYLNDFDCALENYQAYREARPDDTQTEIWITELQARMGEQP